MKEKEDRISNPYEGFSPTQLKSAFWELCHKLPPLISDKDIVDAFGQLDNRMANLTRNEPVEEDPTKLTLQNRAHSELRKAYSDRLSMLLKHAPITPAYVSFIVDHRYGSSYHWGIDPSQFQDLNAFPAYLIGLEEDRDNLGIFDPTQSKNIEKSDYEELLNNHLDEHELAVRTFGQSAIDDLQKRIREGKHPQDPTTRRLENWRKDFIQRYREEPCKSDLVDLIFKTI